MTPEIRISAVVPAYNVEKHVVAALDSLMNQTEKFFEIIVVDDGSTDATGDLVDRYRGAGVTIVHAANNGSGGARNAGLSRANGDYVYFFDADDLLAPHFVASMRELLGARPGVDVVYFSGDSFQDEGFGADYGQSYDRKIDGEYADGVEATGALLRRDAYFAMPCMYLSKRALWRENGLQFMDILHEDEEILMKLSLSAGASICLSKSFYHRRLREGSTMMRPKSQLHAAGYLRTLESIASYCGLNRVKVAPIMPELTRRFYDILGGYFAVCDAGGLRPEYGRVLRHLIALGRFPSPGQASQMWLPPALHSRLSRLKRELKA